MTRGFYLPRVAPESGLCKCFEVNESLDKQTTAGAYLPIIYGSPIRIFAQNVFEQRFFLLLFL